MCVRQACKLAASDSNFKLTRVSRFAECAATHKNVLIRIMRFCTMRFLRVAGPDVKIARYRSFNVSLFEICAITAESRRAP